MKSSESLNDLNSTQGNNNGLEHRILMLETIINNSEAGVYVSDYHTGKILFANQKTVDLLGSRISVDDLIGATCWKVLNAKNTGRCEFCAYKKLVGKNGELLEPYTWEYYFAEVGLWAKITNQAIQWIDGRIAQITTFYDITETKKMEQLLTEHIRDEEQFKMQKNLQMVLDYLPLPIRVVDVETTNIIYVNKKFLKTFEYTPEDVLNRHVSMLVPATSHNSEPYRAKMQEIYHCEDVSNTEITYITSTGKTFIALLTNRIITYNGRQASIGIITDLTAEMEQKRLLVQAAERERESNQLKSSFLSNMSHEIRTPMNAIIGLTEIELRKKPPKETLAIYKKINSSAKNLLQIINDILDLSKIEANKVELFPVEFELEEVLNSAMLVVSPRLEGKRVELILDLSLHLPRFMVGDKTRLWQILRNLLDNAAKFTTKGSIILTVFEDKEQSTAETLAIAFAVTDTGSGMNEEQSKRVFLPYEQIRDDENMRNTGTGLGLPISKQLCELMGGVMHVESRPGCGTIMKFTVPFARSKNTEIEFQALTPPCLADLNVLIVDDSMLFAQAMSGMLQSCGAKSLAVNSGEDALKMLLDQKDEFTFDIIVLDYIMDGMSGLECAKLMRQHLPQSTRILILTAYENLLDKEELALCGIDDIIEKPFVPTHFIRKLADISSKNPETNDCQAETLTTFIDAKVLVCEDNSINQEIISAMLEQFGISAILADNGSIGLGLLNSGAEVDLVFMDLHMPVMDGYETSKAIRSNPKYDALPIISLTADAMVETLNECLTIGINDIITKPTAFEDLQRVLLKWLPESKQCQLNTRPAEIK